MLQKIILFIVVAIIFAACVNEPQPSAETPKTPQKESSAVVETASGKKMVLPDKPVGEDDLMGRMAFGIRTLQEEFDRSSADMQMIGNVKVVIDEQANLLIQNEVNGSLKEMKVNLNDLETGQGGFQLLPDQEEGEYPGLLIHTKQNAQKVAYYVDGKLRQRSGELQLFMVDRSAIERITPAMLQTIRIAQKLQ